MSGAMRRECRDQGAHPSETDASPGELLDALVSGASLSTVVPLTLELVERDPLVSAGCFPGDLLRGLMSVPGHVWACHPRLYDRYRLALRASAALRRQLPLEQSMTFWGPLDRGTRGTPLPPPDPPPGPEPDR